MNTPTLSGTAAFALVAGLIFLPDFSSVEPAVCSRAKRLMQTSANELEPEDRERFLAIPWHVDLIQAPAANVWPDPPR